MRRIMLVVLLTVLLPGCSTERPTPGYKVYVTNRDSGTVTVVMPESGFPTRTVPVGRGPTYLAATRHGDLVLVANTGDSTLSVISTLTDRVVYTLKVGGLLKGVGIDPTDRYALVADEGSGHVVVIDLVTWKMDARIPVGAEPHNFAFDPTGHQAFVTCAGTDSVDVIDLRTLSRTGGMPAGEQPHNIAWHDGLLAVTSRSRPMVYFLDRLGIIDSATVTTGHHGVAIGGWGRHWAAYVTGIAGSRVSIVDLNTFKVAGEVEVGDGPHGIALSPDGLFYFVASSGADEVDVIEWVNNSRQATATSKGGPFWVAVANRGMPADYTNISVDQLQAMMTKKDFLLVGVHMPHEGRIPGTDLIVPYDSIAENLDKFPRDKSAKIVVYCRSGPMGGIAAQALVNAGYDNVFNLRQGYNEWRARGFPFAE